MRRTMLALLLGVATPAVAQSPAQAGLDRLATDMGYRVAIVDNSPQTCPGDAGGCFLSDIVLTVPRDLAPEAAAPELRFSFVSRIIAVESDTFDFRLINGDLNALVLKPGKRLEPGRSYRIRVVGAGHFFSRYYVMPNAYLLAPGAEPRVIAATRTTIDPETGLEQLPFVAPITDDTQAWASEGDATRYLTPERAFDLYASRGAARMPEVAILPRPATVTRGTGEPVDLARGIRVTLNGVSRAEVGAALSAVPAAEIPGGAVPVTIAIRPGRAAESYRLDVGDGRVAIEAADAAGASHALRSLAQQAGLNRGRLRPMTVEDAPRYGFRGLHVDVARNFHSKAELLKLIEQMAAFKLNRLHLHLGDDEGWRLEVKALPELTEVGAFRCLDPAERSCLQPQLGADPARDAVTNGYLTQADYLELLAAAKARQIEVIPSFDMPGHSRATIRAMEVRYDRLMAAGRRAEAERYRLVEPGDATRYRSIQNYDDNTLNVCIDQTYRFLDTVIDEVAALHTRAGTPLKTYHIGADETAGAWSESPACKTMMARTGLQPTQLGAHFIERVSADLAKKGIRVAGWSDGLGHTAAARMPKAVQTNIWGGVHTGGIREAHDQANRGWQVILSMPDMGYLDMPNAPHPDERGYDWASREVNAYRSFAFMPGNLPANAAVIPNIQSKLVPIVDPTPMTAGTIAGMQAQLWSETVRSDAQVDYMLFPRLLAVAERAWHKADWEPAYVPGATWTPDDPRIDRAAILSDWQGFAGRVGAQLPAFDRAGVAYRLAPPGARIVRGRLEANAEYPTMPIEYRVRNGAWTAYSGPVRVRGDVTLRTRSPDGRRASRSVTVKR